MMLAPRTDKVRPGDKLTRWTAGEGHRTDGRALAPAIGEDVFVTEDRLLADTRRLHAALPDDVDLVAGIVRSGMLVAPRLATWRHLPLRAVSQQAGMTNPGHGGRMVGRDHIEPRHVLLVDDTAATGREMGRCVPLVRAAYPDAKLTRAVVYAAPTAIAAVDLFVSVYHGKHYLEWNWQNAGHGEACGYDFDGILCRDFTLEECATRESYRAAMASIEPLYLPRRSRVALIATARHASYEADTRAWLDRHGVRVDRLVMRTWGTADDHGHPLDQVARFKAEAYTSTDCRLFAESDPAQAAAIAQLARRPVLCPAAGRVFPGRPDVATARAEYRAAKDCEFRGCTTGCHHAVCNRDHREVHISECIECKRKGG